MQRLSLDTLQAIAKSKGGECLAESYTNSRQIIPWRCSLGHTWSAPATNIVHSKAWCPFCAGKKHSIEEMQEVAKSRGGVCLSEKYCGMQTKLKWRCAHNHTWEATPAGVVIAGSWCPECSSGLGERLARVAISHILGVPFPKSRPKWLISSRGTQLELDGFSAVLRLAFEHQGSQHYGQTFYTPSFESYKQRTSDDEIKRILCRNNGVYLLEIPEVPRKLSLKDLKGFILQKLRSLPQTPPLVGADSEPNYEAAYRANGNAEALHRLRKLAVLKGGKCLEKNYLGSKAGHRFQCINGHVWATPADSIVQGKWCPQCSAAIKATKTRNPILKLQSYAVNHGGRLISDTYKSSRDKLIWECKKGHTWLASFNSIRAGKWCPHCARCSYEELDEVARKRGGRLISEIVPGVAKSVEWECAKGHKWLARPLNVLHGTWCPHCAKNHPLTIEEMHTLAQNRGGKCLSESYINARTKLRWECSHGHIWDATPYSVKAGTWCGRCSKAKT